MLFDDFSKDRLNWNIVKQQTNVIEKKVYLYQKNVIKSITILATKNISVNNIYYYMTSIIYNIENINNN